MNKKTLIGILVALVVMVSVIAIMQWQSNNSKWGDEKAQNAFEDIATQENTESYIDAVENELSPNDSDATEAQAIQAELKNYAPYVDTDGNLVIGDRDAPVTIHEYSSLTCPHCASFHKQTLPSIKADYINTGKVKFVFHDFPLNRQALSANMLLRCLEPSQRYELSELLFNQQEQWAFDSSYASKLKQYAALIGLSNDKAEACMNDTSVERGILVSMKQASEEYNITSTPSFVITPGEKMITGAAAYGQFSTEIEALMSQ